MKAELRLIYRAFARYGQGFRYIWFRFWIAPKILLVQRALSKPVTHASLSMHMLFGKRDFLMALWSLASFYRVSSMIGKLYVHSDGTLTERHEAILMRLFPEAVFVTPGEIMTRFHEFFETHPDLKLFRLRYTKFQAKKLLDPFLISTVSDRLVLDSDILWFQNPTELQSAVDSGLTQAVMMSDRTGGGERSYVTFKDGSRISEEIASYNSGITLYKKKQFNLRKFSAYLKKVDYLGAKFTDQACYATIFLPNLVRLSEERYIIKGTLTEHIVARHYTNPSRAKFYIYGLDRVWKDILH